MQSKILRLVALLVAVSLSHRLTRCSAEAPKNLVDLSYADAGSKSQRLDLFLPSNASKAAPLLVWIHGGGWREGDKRTHPMRPFIERGYAVASVNYRLSGEAVFPAQIDDVRCALRWLRKHGDQYGYDSKRIGVIGHSAGGHLSALFGVTATSEEAVQAVCVMSGPSDMELLFGRAQDPKILSALTALFGGSLNAKQSLVQSASPINQITSNAPPFLLLHGSKDDTVPFDQAQKFYDALESTSANKSLLMIFQETTHQIFTDPRWLQESLAFFNSHLEP